MPRLKASVTAHGATALVQAIVRTLLEFNYAAGPCCDGKGAGLPLNLWIQNE